MKDTKNAVAQAFGIMGLKPRDVTQVIATLETEHQVVADDSNGFLSLKQNGSEVNPATVLQAYFSKHPEQFVGHSGEIRYKSDVKDTAARVALIREKGYDYWDSLPTNENSPTAKNTVKPVVASTQMKRSEWLQLTPKEKTAVISSWGNDAMRIVQEIQARR